jgi:hypothetical protein
MMVTLITVMTLILILVITLWALSPKLRVVIERPKHKVLDQIRAYENARLHSQPTAGG